MKGFRHLTQGYLDQRVVKDPETGCWNWQLAKWWDGYGMSSVIRDVTRMAHRVAYLIAHGEIPEGLTLDHLCRNRACVNPDHLEPVTQAENTRRAPDSISTVNAAKTHCAQGHSFDEANTYRKKVGGRGCRACNRAAVARYQARRAGRLSGDAA